MQDLDSLLVGCIYRSPSQPINDSMSLLCDSFSKLNGYTVDQEIFVANKSS